jgi:hypothetical protein
MLLRRGQQFLRKAKGLAGQAYAFAHEAAPHIQKAADVARKGYNMASDAGIIDKYGGRRAGAIHSAARTGLDTYDRLERAAGDADRFAKGMM